MNPEVGTIQALKSSVAPDVQLVPTSEDKSSSAIGQTTKTNDLSESTEQPPQLSSNPKDREVVADTLPRDVEKNAAVAPTVQNVNAENQANLNVSLAKTRRDNENALALNSFWVFLGICGMLAGTLIVHRFLLPKIYTCPDGATCHHNLDPSGSIIPRLQTLMQYWLQAGVAIAGWGLTKLIAYNSRFVLKKEGCTIGSLESNLRVVEGSWTDAVLQLTFLQKLMAAFHRLLKSFGLLRDSQIAPVQHGTSWLGILALLQFGIGFFISFVIGFSITNLQGRTNVYVPFTYHDSFSLPHADQRFFSNDELTIATQLNNWLRSPSTGSPHPTSIFDGTLVLRDNRTTKATDPQPSGSRITGEISCGRLGWNVAPLSINSSYFADGHGGDLTGAKAYNFSSDALANVWFVTYSYTTLASQFVSTPVLQDSVTTRQYLWASNTSSVIPNATASHDGGIHYAVCNHTAQMVDLPPVKGSNVQAISPSQPIIYSNPDDPNVSPCPSDDPLVCVPWSVDDIILAWWQLNVVEHDLVPFSCLSWILAGFNAFSDTPECNLTSERWAKTLGMTLDALISIAPVTGNATQTLWASTEAINTDRWWIQVVLPGATFILYLLCIAYTLYLSGWGKYELKEVDFPQVLCRKGLDHDSNDIRNTKITIQ